MPSQILITGASRGFGKDTAVALLLRGHSILAALRGGEDRGREIFGESAIATGRLHFVDVPLDQPEAIASVAAWIDRNWQGRLDVLVNNAGYGLMGPLEHQTDEQVRRQMEVNFFAPLALARQCLPALKRSAADGRRPRIINLSSIAGLVSFPFYGAYNASKFALEAVSEALHYELLPFGVQVALVEPGGFKTGFNQSVEFTAIDASRDPVNATRLGAFQRAMRGKSQFGGDPRHVTALLVRLCERKRIGLRNVIGKDALAMNAVKRLLPDSLRVRFEAFLFERLFFGA
jgi:NAD(P)-dependent dehydrogenase (short-subunit alcohol dehydrogenase family)